MAMVLFCLPALSQLQIINSNNAQALAQKLVGGGVTISNVTMSASPHAAGFFIHWGGAQLNLDSGIVLSTGRTQTTTAFGMNGSQGAEASSDLFFPGDPSLEALVSPNLSFDAAILEFDFVPQGDSVSFRYVFSSEEYPTYVCSIWNDVFAFFISGPGITGTQNLAVVPGTNIPVTINSINSGTPGTSGSLPTCQAMGPGSPFSMFYVNNTGNNIFTHNGHTKVLTAKAAVIPCQTYHLKIAISDASDGILDSGVFLEAGSLASDPVEIASSLPTFNGQTYVVEGCQPGAIQILRSRKELTAQTVNLSFGGNAVNGVDVQTIPSTVIIPANDSVVTIPIIALVDNIAEPLDSIQINITSMCQAGGNMLLDSIVIYIRDYDFLTITPPDTTLCNNVPVQLMAQGNFAAVQWSPATGLSDANIANPIATPETNITYIATTTTADCHARDSVVLKVKSLKLIATSDVNCKNGTTGSIAVSGGELWKAPVQYSINNQPYGNDSTFANLPAGVHVVRVKDITGCIDSLTITLVQSFPDLELADSLVAANCLGANGEAFITGAGGLQPYTYSVDAGSFSGTANFQLPGGNHTLAIKDANGCITTKPVVISTDPPISINTTLGQSLCDGSVSGYIYITATGGNGQYTYSLDGTNFQVADSFMINTNSFTVTVRDSKGCSGTTTVTIPVLEPVYVNAGNDTTICEGQGVQFNAGNNGTSIVWSPSTSLSNANIPNPLATPTTTTTYYVTATRNLCEAKDTVTVTVNPVPVANAGPDSTICFGRTINLTGSGGGQYTWLPASGLNNPAVANPPVKPAQTTPYYLQVTGANGCKSRYDTVVITVTPPIQVFAGADSFIAVGQAIQLQGMDLGGSGANIYNWSPATGLSDPAIANPIATLNSDMTYTLTLSTAEGCQGTDQVTIKVYDTPEIYVPSGFTPNGDGLNDVLRAIPVGMKQFKYFRVFNRWGQQVFAASNPALGWDGKVSGVKQNTGTFVWIAEGVDYRGNPVVRKGVSTLIR